MPVALSAPHWLPVRRMKKIPSRAARSGTRGLWQPSGWLGRGGSSGAIRSHKASGIRQPRSWIIWPIDLLQTGTILKEQQPGRQILPTGIGSKGCLNRSLEGDIFCRLDVGCGHTSSSSGKTREGYPMLYAILCYDSEDIVGAWTKEEEDAAMAKLAVVREKLAREGRLGPVARLLPTTAA